MKKIYGRNAYKTHKTVNLNHLLQEPTNKRTYTQAAGVEFSDSDTETNDKTPNLDNGESPLTNNTQDSFLSSASMFSEVENKVSKMKTDVPDSSQISDPLNGLLDFLTVPKRKHKAKRVKLTPRFHTEQVPENTDFDFKEALTDVSTFVESLQQPDEFDGFENENKKADVQIERHATSPVAINDGSLPKKNVYGAYRSMLRSFEQHEGDDDELSQKHEKIMRSETQDDNISSDEEEKSRIDDAEKTNKNAPLTQNFNQLKTMGSNIQYNDDIRFVMEGSLPGAKKLITMIQEIRASEGLQSYIANYYSDEFWQMLQSNAGDPYLLTVLCVLERMHKKLEVGHFVQLFCYTPRTDLGKYYQTKYEDIIKIFGNHRNLGLATLNNLKETKPMILEDSQIIDFLARIPFCRELLSLLPFVKLDTNAKKFWKLTTNLNIQKNIENVDYIKSCVSLTNTKNFDTRNVTNLLNYSLRYILKNFQDTDRQHLLILHLGLCSNILHIHKNHVSKVSCELSSIYENLDMTKLDFVHNLFLLNYAYLLKFAGKEIDDLMKKCLLCWAKGIDDLNDSFKERVDYILST
ncbi:hypothetical protein ACO0QE_004151 [Hanseniaspora vineae]